jgi:uroporphyrinogen-III decarboxylase
MTPKERLLAALRGREVDRVPWSPFLAYFWESLPREEQDRGQVAFLEQAGADPLLRGFHTLHRRTWERTVVRERIRGNEKLVEWETPVGTLRSRHVYAPQGNTWFLTEHPVRTREDFTILAFINQDTRLEPDHAQFIRDSEALGDRGLYLPVIGSELKTSFQSMIEHWVGTEELAYALADFPEAVEECLLEMRRNALESARIAADSTAEAFIFWEDSSTTNLSPDLFRRYTAPEIGAWASIMHGAGKLLVHHACGHVRALLADMAATGVDAVESLTPPPVGDVTAPEARAALGGGVSIVGGIDPTVFLNATVAELQARVRELMAAMGTRGFILANADSCPPGVAREKFAAVSRWVRDG